MQRVLTHYRFGKPFGWLKRHVSSRRSYKKFVRDLYLRTGLAEDGCRLCGGDDFTLLAESDRYGFDLKKQFCNGCGLVQTYPSPPPEFLNEFYAHHYRRLYTKSNDAVDYRKLMPEQNGKGRLLVDYLDAQGFGADLGERTLIEIGCSSGGIIAEAAKRFGHVQGCDLDVDAIRFAKDELGLDVELGAFPSRMPEGPKVVLMSHVLEHLYDPLGTLKRVREVLGPDDLLCILVPGMNAVRDGDYKHDLRRYFHIAHLSDFTAGTLTKMAGVAGFETLHADEVINALFRPAEAVGELGVRAPEDTVENILSIEETYR